MKAYKIGKSKIHGFGLFAERDILKGEFIAEYKGQIIDKEESYKREQSRINRGDSSVYTFEIDDNFDLDGNFEYNDARFINHACRPNCECVLEGLKINFYALRDIKKGEEILYNYSYKFENCLKHPCKCGFPECVGYILSKEDWPKLRKLKRNRRIAKELKSKKNK